MNPNIGLTDEQREGVVKILNTLLSDEYLLYTKTRNYHWNVLGPQFNDLHKFFEEQYTELNEKQFPGSKFSTVGLASIRTLWR